MDFRLPGHLVTLLAEVDAFIEDAIAPIQARDDDERFFDHRRDDSRTDWHRGGLPKQEWEALLGITGEKTRNTGVHPGRRPWN